MLELESILDGISAEHNDLMEGTRQMRIFGSPGSNIMRSQLYSLGREMDNLFNSLSQSSSAWTVAPWKDSRLMPLLNVTETVDSFTVTCEMPGIRTDDLEIKIEGETLTLKGERKPDPTVGVGRYHRRERATGCFQRSIRLPRKIDEDAVTASYRNGVLRVTLLKEMKPLTRQIKISAE
jgi:HSP20 family protein